jgi:hypothetical protein
MKALMLFLAVTSLAQAQTYERAFNSSNRLLKANEKVIYDNSYVKVQSQYKQVFIIESSAGYTSTVSRDSLAIISGCNSELCVGDTVIDLTTASYVEIAGISTNETFITKSNETALLSSGKVWLKIARTEGCTRGRWAPVCVGLKVKGYEVVGIQFDNRVVLSSAEKGILTNVDTNSLGVVIE